MKKTLLHTVSHNAIACELNSYGISVVYAQPDFPGKRPQEDFKAFIDYNAIDQGTPILLSPVIVRLGQFDQPLTHNEAYFVQRTGWLFSPGEDVIPEQMTELLLSRLMAGQPVTLIPQTARALPLESIDIWEHTLTKLEQAVLKSVVEWQRGHAAKPIVLAFAVADGKRTVSTWRPALSWTDASRRFAPTSRKVRRLLPHRPSELGRK